MGIHDVMAGLVAEKKEKKESKHYIHFDNKEWTELEAAAGRELLPKDLKTLLKAIFKGELKVMKP